MKDIVRVIRQDDTQRIARGWIRFPLGLKAVFVLVLAMLPLCAAAGIAAYLWQASAGLPPYPIQLLAAQIPVFSYEIRLYYFAEAALALFGMCLGFLALEYFFIH